MNPILYRPIIAAALAEDIQHQDITGAGIISEHDHCSAQLIAKEDGIAAGLAVFKETFLLHDSSLEVTLKKADGNQVSNKELVAELSGPVQSVLAAERVALNLLQRMSGIASLTRRFVDLCAGQSRILDTRKTAPNLRVLDKWAVRLGGGMNHRMGLYDMAMLKENHIKAAGGIENAVKKLRDFHDDAVLIEVEVTNLDELKQALACDVYRIMLDNMSNDEMRKAVALADGKTPLEASGNVNLDTVADIAATGVDFISVGALTHSVKALDYSLLVQ
ncbi:nicotinate-nucleotide diphosphorylase (carboxylating) [Marinicella pacifica]|uniref:Probable nicotinate-nucleotide pyrophosphorylase [carboxylating] n=1 Tax=Marinicella pacifica TaxID=1171543 RepID=A0A917FPR1_9GAMM|nr:carboxylating nicotinate-nucleotide diphosphorylase [Marinicella pacifica]GGF96335.1 nicotinate-nucleotide diphosphorylase (carboxylating) [Marinicella pacifica]